MDILPDKRDVAPVSYYLSDPEYPDSDGKRMADNTLQFEWIVTIKEGLENLYADSPDVFVAGDLLWYPVQGDNKLRQAPDTMVAFGRPKGYRGSYRQWVENNIAPQVVFEILSPGNRAGEMARKAAFYERFGVEEYYVYNPYRVRLSVFGRNEAEGTLTEIPQPPSGYVSPRLGIRFDLSGDDMVVYRPDGEPFKSNAQLFAERDVATARADVATAERDVATAERDAATARAERLAVLLREAGIEPD